MILGITPGSTSIKSGFSCAAVEDNPIIAAVKSMEDVEECCKHDDIRVIFILFGDVCSIGFI